MGENAPVNDRKSAVVRIVIQILPLCFALSLSLSRSLCLSLCRLQVVVRRTSNIAGQAPSTSCQESCYASERGFTCIFCAISPRGPCPKQVPPLADAPREQTLCSFLYESYSSFSCFLALLRQPYFANNGVMSQLLLMPSDGSSHFVFHVSAFRCLFLCLLLGSFWFFFLYFFLF